MTPGELSDFLHGTRRNIHLIGVSGSGMSGIAALLIALGHSVSGSDRTETPEILRLAKKGLSFTTPHSAACVADAELVVYSSAVKSGNPAFDEAVRRAIPACLRADALAAIMRGRKGIVVAGMHGKTTTSAMAAHVLRAAGVRTSHYVGAEIPILGANARWDSEGDFFVAEGDESDGTLVNYLPFASIILNVESEHLDFYRNLDEIDSVFRRLVSQTSGPVVFCADDSGAARVCLDAVEPISYGESSRAKFRMEALRLDAGNPVFDVLEDGILLGEVRLGIPGRHNALNALAVIALARRLGADFQPVADALARFEGAKRRFETIYRDREFHLVDDYGHHPTEIAATLATARSTGCRRVVVMFQPHRFSRTQALADGFGKAFADADVLAVTGVYPAGEQPIPGITGAIVVDGARNANVATCIYEPSLSLLPAAIGPLVEPGDLILSLGAGNVHEAARHLAGLLAERGRLQSVMGPGTIRLLEPLARHTTLRVGGPADFWVEPETGSGFADLVRHCTDNGLPLVVIGRGSNLLVRDGGIRGVVAHLARGEFSMHRVEGNEITAGAGVRFKQIAAIARKAGIGGFEWMDGIPGSLGGGLRMNAGAMGWQTFDQVVRLQFCDEEGNLFTQTPDQMEVRYRDVPSLARNYALSATLRGTPDSPENIVAKLRQSEEKRKRSQPVAASAGCIFKNPASAPAGRLIEEAALKGRRIGGALVSETHGNFIVNDGGASAADVLALIELVRNSVLEKCGVALETEVQVIGEETYLL